MEPYSMSHRLISHNDDLKRLQDEGYNIEVRDTLLLIHDVPYVNEKGEVKRATLVSTLGLNADITQSPVQDHVVWFTGEYPCKKIGSKMTMIVNETRVYEIVPGLVVNHSFSSKPIPPGYLNYYDKMTRYIALLSNEAQSIDPRVTPKTFPLIKEDEEDSVFKYKDTLSSRAGISTISAKLSNHKVAIIGLGGTGSYILDLIAKTQVHEIHIYDADEFQQHNAFRAPGAASIENLNGSKKVYYYFGIYSRMRYGIIPHSHNIDESNIDLLKTMEFVFLCIDGNQTKRVILNQLEALGIPFIDCGIGVYATDEKLAGIIRVTTCTSSKNDHLSKHVICEDDGKNEYSKNIQIADLNALNAVLAVIKWKKICGFYNDIDHEHHMTYTIDGNIIANEEFT